MQYKNLCYFLFLFIYLGGCINPEVKPTDEFRQKQNLLLGNPSEATTIPANVNNFLVQTPQYSLSYSRSRGIPNWVSWHINKDWLGNAARQDDFRANYLLPKDWYKVTAGSYSSSGFDRGHHCPSADRTSSTNDNSATFLMTNMIPQAPQHNQEIWANLENYTRDLVQAGNEVYVIMGSYGKGGSGNNGTKQTIDGGKVTVPKQIWKVLLVLPEGNDDLNRIKNTTRVIAVNTPNSNSVNPDWGKYRTTVDAIEKATGYDIFTALPKQLQEALESKVDNGPTQ